MTDQTKPATATDLETIAKRIAECACVLGKEPCSSPGKDGHKHCLAREEARPLTKTEHKRGWAKRPFGAYDDGNMCDSCSAYWHASVAQARTLGLARMAAITEAEEARRGAR